MTLVVEAMYLPLNQLKVSSRRTGASISSHVDIKRELMTCIKHLKR